MLYWLVSGWLARRYPAGLAGRFSERARERAYRAGLVLLVGGFAVTFAVLSVLQHDAFGTHAWDAGIFDQVIWNTANGNPWQVTITVQSPHYLGQHFAPWLLVLVPLYMVSPDPRWLYAIQAVLIALAGVPIAWYARERLKSRALALLAVAVYLLLPATAYVTLFDFHEIALAAPLVALTGYALMTRRNRLFVASAAVACLAKEDVGIVIFGFGLYAILAQRRWKLGAITLVASFIWLTLLVNWIIPSFNPGGPYYAAGRYSNFGSSPAEVVFSLLTNPVRALLFVFSPTRVLYLLYYFATTAFVPLLGLQSVVVVAPVFAYLLLSNEFADFVITQHYGAIISPLIALLAVDALARVQALGQRVRSAAAAGMLVALVTGAYLFGPIPGSRQFDPEHYNRNNPHYVLGRQLAASFPPDAGIAAQDNLVPHVSRRERVYLYPDVTDWDRVQYIWLDEKTSKYPLDDEDVRYRRYVRGTLTDPDYELVREEDGFRILERRPWEMPNPVDVRLGDAIRIEGYEARLSEEPERAIELSLYWRTTERLPEEYTLFVHVLGPDGQVSGQIDQYPTTHELPTTWWEPGRLYRERYRIPLQSGAADGPYEVRIGLYLLRTLERLPVAAPEGRERDRAFVIPVATPQEATERSDG